mmetsp:Transcript_11281/g.10911  ORF Transcript_11281/g.10911 Transcript_11281/m.10911 type:complete len:595 (-) Transcript_11281:8-1792(-)
MSYLFYGINSAVKYARDGYSKELSDFLSKKPHLINQKNKNGNSILHIACWKGDCEMVLMLLMRGANVNTLDSKGYTPLLVAIEFGHDQLAISLLERGADIKIGNEALCLPLHVAALSGSKNIIIPLLEWGADIDAIETNGCTPLLCALRNKHSDVAIILIDKGADITARDREDWLPVRLAQMNGMTAVVARIGLQIEYQHARISANREEIQRREGSIPETRRGGGSLSSAHEDSAQKENRILSVPKLSILGSNQLNSPHSGSHINTDTWVTDKWGGIEEEQIVALRSQSQRSLVHTITHNPAQDDVASFGGGGGSIGDRSKGSKSIKKKRKERRNSNPNVSTTATAAAIEAVAKAMEDSGGDLSRAVAVLMQQQEEQKLQLKVKRKQNKMESRDKSQCDEYSISVMSEGTSSSSKSRSKKKKKSAKNIEFSNDDGASVTSGRSRSSQRSVQSTSMSGRTCFGLEGDDNVSMRSSSGDNVSVKSSSGRRGSILQPIEEELVIRGGSRSSSKSSVKGSVERSIGSRRHQFNPVFNDDDDDIGPPAVFCFWVRPNVSKVQRITDAPTTATQRGGITNAPTTTLIASPNNNKAACVIM